jgi:hypothetical protein
MASRPLDFLYDRLDEFPQLLTKEQLVAVRSMLQDLDEFELIRMSNLLAKDQLRIQLAAESFAEADFQLPLFAPDWMLGLRQSPPASEGHLQLLSMYLSSCRAGEFWDRILAGNLEAYALFVHEWVEFIWILNQYGRYRLNAFWPRDQVIAYDVAHAIALLLEHRYLKVLSDMRFSLRELILANPYATDGEADWGFVVELVETYPFPLDKREWRLDHLEEARQWYRERGIRPLLILDWGAPVSAGDYRL